MSMQEYVQPESNRRRSQHNRRQVQLLRRERGGREISNTSPSPSRSRSRSRDDNHNRNRNVNRNSNNNQAHQGRNLLKATGGLIERRIADCEGQSFCNLKGKLYCQACKKEVSTKKSDALRHCGMFI